MSGIPVTGFNELVLEVLDLDRAVPFYSDVVELAARRPLRGRAAYVTDPDGNVVELWTWAG